MLLAVFIKTMAPTEKSRLIWINSGAGESLLLGLQGTLPKTAVAFGVIVMSLQ
ncbi:hypothetical protein [Pseudomonas gregormendelii]